MKLVKEFKSCECDLVRLLKEDGTELLVGDYYHNKISYRIDGYLQALIDFGIDFVLEKKEIPCPECESYEYDSEES